MLKFFAALSST